jgi:hypothetical protein
MQEEYDIGHARFVERDEAYLSARREGKLFLMVLRCGCEYCSDPSKIEQAESFLASVGGALMRPHSYHYDFEKLIVVNGKGSRWE